MHLTEADKAQLSEEHGDVTHRDIVLFLGAGFSRGAMLPTMREFGSASDHEYRSLIEGTRQQKRITGYLRQAAETYRDFVEYCKQCKHVQLDISNLEDVFCIAEMLEVTGVQEIHVSDRTYAPHYILDQIRIWLWKIYQQCPLLTCESGIDGQRHVPNTAYWRWADSLRAMDAPSRLTVVTTNYDLVFEYLMWDLQHHCVYPLARHADYVPMVIGDASPSYLTAQDARQAPLICKLHGSVNYFQGLDHTNEESLGITENIANHGSRIGESYIPEAQHTRRPSYRPAIFAVDGLWALRARYGGGIVPAIIPPSYAKLARIPWLRRTWNVAYKALQNAKLIIFIGYSLPRSDGFMRSLLQASLMGQSNKPSPRIVVVDRDGGEVFTRNSEIFPHLNESDKIHSEFCAVVDQLIEQHIQPVIAQC